MQCSWWIFWTNKMWRDIAIDVTELKDKFMSMKMSGANCDVGDACHAQIVFMKWNKWTKITSKIRQNNKLRWKYKQNIKCLLFELALPSRRLIFSFSICLVVMCDLFYRTLKMNWLLFSEAFIRLQFLDWALLRIKKWNNDGCRDRWRANRRFVHGFFLSVGLNELRKQNKINVEFFMNIMLNK